MRPVISLQSHSDKTEWQTDNLYFFNHLNFNNYGFRVCSNKRVFGFDKDKNEKYVAKSVRSGRVSFSKMCGKVSRLCGVHRKVVDLVVSGLVDMMAEDIDDGKSVQMGEFGIFSPTIRAKSADDEKEVSSKSIVQRKILFYPGKIFKTTLDDMSITRRAELDTDYTDGSSNNGSGSEKPNPGGDGGKDDEEAPDPTV